MKVIKNKKLAYFSVAITIAGTLLYICPPQFLTTSAATTQSGDWKWEVNVQEQLALTVTMPNGSGSSGTSHTTTATKDGSTSGDTGQQPWTGTWPTGDANTFLSSSIGVGVSSNNAQGYTLGMTTETSSTDLVNAIGNNKGSQDVYKLPTLTSDQTCESATTCNGFAAGYWGYALAKESTNGASSTSTSGQVTYKKLVGSDQQQITVLSSTNNQANATNTVYFGAKAGNAKASGTYTGVVVFTLTSGTQGKPIEAKPSPTPGTSGGSTGGGIEGPDIFDEPANDVPQTPSGSQNSGSGSNISYPSNSSNGSTGSIALNNEKKDKDTASNYIAPLGALERTSADIHTTSPVTIILMIVAFTAAVIGFFFFILAKRHSDDDEDEITQ